MQLKYLFLLDYTKYPNFTSPFYLLNTELVWQEITGLGRYANQFRELHPELKTVKDVPPYPPLKGGKYFEYVVYDFLDYLGKKGKNTAYDSFIRF